MKTIKYSYFICYLNEEVKEGGREGGAVVKLEKDNYFRRGQVQQEVEPVLLELCQ